MAHDVGATSSLGSRGGTALGLIGYDVPTSGGDRRLLPPRPGDWSDAARAGEHQTSTRRRGPKSVTLGNSSYQVE
jgi:hypothetical protein